MYAKIVGILVPWICFFICENNATFLPPRSIQALRHADHHKCPIPNTWTNIALRYPPTVRYNSADRAWIAPARSFLYGNWWVSHSSRMMYQSLYNFQHDCYPVLPSSGSVETWPQVDLTSWNLPPTGNVTKDKAIGTAFGYDTPRVDIAPFVFTFKGTGSLQKVTNSWELVAWGYDTTGTEYRVEYETAVMGTEGEPCLNFVSRAKTGPSSETLKAIFEMLKKTYSADPNLSAYVANVTKLPLDNRRDGLGPVACNDACMMNAASG